MKNHGIKKSRREKSILFHTKIHEFKENVILHNTDKYYST